MYQRRTLRYIVCLVILAGPVQLTAAQETTRQEEIRKLRLEKADTSERARRTWLESGVIWLERRGFREKWLMANPRSMSIRPRVGDVGVSGPAVGVQVDISALHLSGLVSMKKFQQYELGLDLPSLAGGAAFVAGGVRYRNQPQLNFFGLGGESTEPNRSDFLFEDATYSVSGGVRPMKHVRVGADLAWQQVNIGSGTQSDIRNTELAFTDSTAPGLDSQPDFLRTGFFAEYDSRDEKGNPRRGGLYRVDYAFYDDWRSTQFDFRRLQAEVHQYIPFTRGHRVIATRFAVSFDDPAAGHRVPFYMQRTLGGPDDLRGFRPFRFRDLNQMLVNVEYRWKAWAGLDMVLFGDAGKVFSDRRDFNFTNLETSYGIGFRVNTLKNTIFRADVARSREGFRWFAGVGATFR